jgi:hypothetical protein
MTRLVCDDVAERVALGESLAELAEHAATCTTCQPLVAMATRLAAARHDVDPGLGFSARMTVGAQHRIAVRRRRRLAVGFAATVAASSLGVFVVTRAPQAEHSQLGVAPPQPAHEPAEQPLGDDDLAALVQLADVDQARHLSARWGHIERPLAPYRTLIRRVTP